MTANAEGKARAVTTSRPKRSQGKAPAVLGAFFLCWLGLSVAASKAHAAGDPYLEWHTIETAHFRIHYHHGLEEIADRLARLAEGVHERLVPSLGWTPREMTEIVVTDDSDSANGSATALPYGVIRLFVTAPDDMSPLGDYDDWHNELFIHEYAHILQMDNVTGLPALVNAIAGRSAMPNQAQPRWLLEGLAVMEESRHSGGGRNRSSIFDMYLRADVIEDNLATLDQVSHLPRRFPQGNVWYLYGSRFLTWIVDTYGQDTMKIVAHEYGAGLIPWGVNRAIRRATGRTYVELYDGFRAYLKRHYGEQLEKVRRVGLREGTRLTHGGQLVGRPRFLPEVARRDAETDELLYYRDDGHSRTGFYRAKLTRARDAFTEEGAELVIRASGRGSASFDPQGGIVFDTTATTKRIYSFRDLFSIKANETAESGREGATMRLTEGNRAQDPDVSPDGRSIVFVENHRGTTTLILADRGPSGELARKRALVPSARFEQAFTPRFSPDGRRVAYSAWKRGGYRDIRIVDVESGEFYEIARDRAMDMQPSWSPDGRYVYFSSDRAYGIHNIFAYDTTDGSLRQVTNVETGAFQPEASPDGKTFVYVGFTSKGFDLYAMNVAEETWLEPPPYIDPRPDAHAQPSRVETRTSLYNPLPSLRPRAWEPTVGPGSFGTAISISTSGADAVGLHGFAATLTTETERPDPQISLSYSYNRLPFDYRVGFFRSLAPRSFRYNDEQSIYTEENIGLRNSISYRVPGRMGFDASSYNLSYTISRFDGDLPLSRTPDPYARVWKPPARGQLGVVHLGYSYSNAERRLFGIGPDRGVSLALGVDVADEVFGSDYTLYVFSYSGRTYFPMPWARHHTVAVSASGALAGGDSPRRGLFHTGGFVQTPIIDQYTSGIFQSGFVLRGYEPVSFIGSQYHLANLEYRFPILNVDRGVATLPAFLGPVTGAVFADYGGAFDTLETSQFWKQFHLGVGAELWAELTFGYFLTTNLRFGYARGVADEAAAPGGQFYLVVAAPF